jgi:hypothetical protein
MFGSFDFSWSGKFIEVLAIEISNENIFLIEINIWLSEFKAIFILKGTKI